MKTIDVAIDTITVPRHRLRRSAPDVVDSFVDSIGQRGLLQPILLRREGERLVLVAGANRLTAVRRLGHKRIAARILAAADAAAAELVEIDENLVRDELSPAERAAHHARRKVLHDQLQAAGARDGSRKNGHDARGQLGHAGRYDLEAATATGQGARSIRREIQRGGIRDVARLAGTSLDQGTQLDALAQLPPAAQASLIKRAVAGEKVNARAELKKVKRQDRERSVAARTEARAPLGQRRYGVVYADPPWRHEVWSDAGKDRAAENHYPTMPTEEICALAPPAADDAVLALWAIIPMLPEALQVMKAWGFTYRSHCVWTKPRAGTGYWFRGQHELLLIGTRGGIPAPAPGTQSSSVRPAALGRHSAKPACFAAMLEDLYPSAARLEMFARDARTGWDAWGNEAPPSKPKGERHVATG